MTEPPPILSPPRRSLWFALFRIVPVIAFGIFLWREKPWRVDLAGLPKLPLLGMLALYFTVYLPAKGLRWRAVLTDPPPFRTIMAATLDGIFAGIVIGFGANDFVRSARLGRSPGHYAGDLGATLAERGIEQSTMGLIVLGSAVFGPMHWIVGLIAGLTVLATVMVALLGSPVARLLERWRLPRVAIGLRAAVGALTLRRVAWVTVLALAGWAGEVIMLMLTLGAFGLPADVGTATLVLVGINAAVSFPGPPANLGTFEAGIVAALYWRGIETDAVIPFAVAYHLLNVVPVACLSAVVLLWRGAKPPPP